MRKDLKEIIPQGWEEVVTAKIQQSAAMIQVKLRIYK